MNAQQHDFLESDGRDEVQTIQSRKSLYIIGTAIMLLYAALEGLFSLQSSMNVEEGLGTTSVMVVFITSSISCIVFVPFMIDYYGPKAANIVGSIGVSVYIAANFYPSWYTLIPAAMFFGLFESCCWVGAPVYITYLAEQRWLKKSRKSISTKIKPMESYIYRFLGHFYSFFFVGTIISFVLIILVLLGFKNLGVNNDSNNSTNVNEIINLTINVTPESPVYLNPMEKCGANDCPAEYIYDGTEEELAKYNPNQTSTYLLLGIFISMAITAIVIQAVFLPRAPAKYDKVKTSHSEVKELGSGEIQVAETDKVASITGGVIDALKRTMRHIISPLHILVAPMFFYHGVYYAYYITEYTRAFVSCTVGVEQLGIVLTVVAVTSALVTNFNAWLLGTVGRHWYFLVFGGTHIAFYLISLFWTPNPANSWFAYLLPVILGVCISNIMILVQSLIVVYFHDRVGVAFSAKNAITNLGIVAATGWSPSLCVSVKIYLQIGLLIISLICLSGAEILFKRKIKK